MVSSGRRFLQISVPSTLRPERRLCFLATISVLTSDVGGTGERRCDARVQPSSLGQREQTRASHLRGVIQPNLKVAALPLFSFMIVPEPGMNTDLSIQRSVLAAIDYRQQFAEDHSGCAPHNLPREAKKGNRGTSIAELPFLFGAVAWIA